MVSRRDRAPMRVTLHLHLSDICDVLHNILVWLSDLYEQIVRSIGLALLPWLVCLLLRRVRDPLSRDRHKCCRPLSLAVSDCYRLLQKIRSVAYRLYVLAWANRRVFEGRIGEVRVDYWRPQVDWPVGDETIASCWCISHPTT